MKKAILLFCGMMASVATLKAQDNRLVSSSSITLQPVALYFNYETPLGYALTVVGRGGLSMDLASGVDKKTYFALHPVVGVEPRFYHNFARRVRLGKLTTFNSANYLSLDCRYVFRPIASRRDHSKEAEVSLNDIIFYGFGDYECAILAPTYGIRRVFGFRWLLECEAGANFVFDSSGYLGTSAKLNIKFGYVF